MTLLMPLGLLGLISLIVLLIIYIIRPNYQQRVISSTFIWQLSLKYKKKRVPISKLRNLLLILCQILVLLCCTAVLARPSRELLAKESGEEAIIIVDCSASMRMQSDGETRFERALNDSIDLANFTFNNSGKVSLILADEDPDFLISRITPDKSNEFVDTVNGLMEGNSACTFGKSDIDGALALCEDIIAINEYANVFVYTDNKYIHVPEKVTVEDVSVEEDWNVAILNAYTSYDDGYYNFFVDVACYGRNFEDLQLVLDVYGVNAEADETQTQNEVLKPTGKLDIMQDTVYTIAFRHNTLPDGQTPPDNMIIVDQTTQIYSYESIHVSILEDGSAESFRDRLIYYDDALYEDNDFYIYGGTKTPLKVMYVSTLPNTFVNQALLTMKKIYEENWDITIEQEVFIEELGEEISGYDLYIFEHAEMPTVLPTDGVVLILSPQGSINGSGVNIGGLRSIDVPGGLSPEIEVRHPLLNNITPEHIFLNAYNEVVSYDTNRYECILSVMEKPLILVANDDQMKVVYFTFSIHYTNFPLVVDFPLFFYNLFEYFYPATVEKDAFEVNEDIILKSLGGFLDIKGNGYSQKIEYFPATIKLNMQGSYTITQQTFSGKELTNSIYVKMPSAESDVSPDAEGLYNPYINAAARDYYADWLLYIAIGLTVFMFAEWLLQLRDNM